MDKEDDLIEETIVEIPVAREVKRTVRNLLILLMVIGPILYFVTINSDNLFK